MNAGGGSRRHRLAIIGAVVVALAVIGQVLHAGARSDKPKAGGAWLTPRGVNRLKADFPTSVGDDVTEPIQDSTAECGRTSTQGVYLCTVDTQYDDQIAYFVTVNSGSWTGLLDARKTHEVSNYPINIRGDEQLGA